MYLLNYKINLTSKNLNDIYKKITIYFLIEIIQYFSYFIIQNKNLTNKLIKKFKLKRFY